MEKILICTNHFYPETFRCNDVAFELANRGYDVTVLTAIPDYPKGEYFDGYGIFRRRRETVNGVKVIRGLVWRALSKKPLLNMILNVFTGVFQDQMSVLSDSMISIISMKHWTFRKLFQIVIKG